MFWKFFYKAILITYSETSLVDSTDLLDGYFCVIIP